MISCIERKTVRYETDGGKPHSVDYMEIRGLSADEKPAQYVANGSSFLEMDTGNLFFFDEESRQWLNPWGGG